MFILAGLAFVIMACGVGALALAALRPPDLYFMPGPLGRVPRPSVGGSEVRRDRGSAAREVRASRKSEDQKDGWSVFRRGASDQPNLRDSGYRTRAFSGLSRPDEIKWGERNGLTSTLEFIHHLAAVFPPELFKTHPEYFPFAHGRRIEPPQDRQFWQPDLGRADVAAYAAERAKRYFDAHPSAETFSLGINDGLLFGESPETLALVRGPARASRGSEGQRFRGSASEPRSTHQPPLRSTELPNLRPTEPPSLRSTGITYFRGRPDFSRLIFTFMNRAAADLARSHPDKYLGCLAYYWCEDAPPFDVDPHVIPFLTADRSQSYDPAFKREEFALQARWARALSVRSPRAGGAEARSIRGADVLRSAEPQIDGNSDVPRTNQPGIQPRLGLYDYLDGCGFLIPRVPIHAFTEHIRHAYEVGFTDYYGEASRNWGLDGPLPWVIAQLLQNPEQDVDRLLDTYYATYFQSSSGPMRTFFDRCEQQWMHQPGPSYWLKHYRNPSQATLFPSNVCAELRTLLNEAAAQANGDTVRKRVAFVADAFGLTERFVALCEVRSTLTSRVLQHQLAGAEGERLLTDYRAKRHEFIRYGHALSDRSPLAFCPINYDDWLREDPTFAAERELVASSRRGSGVQLSRRSVGQTLPADTPINRTSDQLAARDSASGREILQNGALAGALISEKRVAGLQYRIDLPPPWGSRVEPTEHGVATLVEMPKGGTEPKATLANAEKLEDRRGSVAPRTHSRVLRFSGNESALAFAWAPAVAGRVYAASVWARGNISPGNRVELAFGWANAQQKPIGMPIVMRLPDGSWPDWVQLEQGAKAPNGAAWVAIDVLAQHQVGDDWAEVRNFSMREIAP